MDGSELIAIDWMGVKLQPVRPDHEYFMRDISQKITTLRTAIAQSTLRVSPATISLIRKNKIPKGDPLPVAKVAAIQAAKNTSSIIPYCHPLPVDFVGVEFEIGKNEIEVKVEVKAIYKTGVEMEALTGASVAALTLYDMMKMLDDDMEILGVKLLSKKGGKSDFAAVGQHLRAAVLVMSDSVAAGKKEDVSGKIIQKRLQDFKIEVIKYDVVPDDAKKIEEKILSYTDKLAVDLVVTTGGTGFGPRDNTPEAVRKIIEREMPGVNEAARTYGQQRTPLAMLSRSVSGIRGKTIIVSFPGSKGAVTDGLDALFPAILHAFKMLKGEGH
ncbi:MAG TPA: bifunctional molybdenum cofactor biosynthesis protein MoaC/MoaB [Bacteroidota bacterium]|nr:bifunctional molybdenum cofactor biosynthesis protein MoaC/MoaB [Bacteroidota bacterium]